MVISTLSEVLIVPAEEIFDSGNKAFHVVANTGGTWGGSQFQIFADDDRLQTEFLSQMGGGDYLLLIFAQEP